jgi:hypothetical protein
VEGQTKLIVRPDGGIDNGWQVEDPFKWLFHFTDAPKTMLADAGVFLKLAYLRPSNKNTEKEGLPYYGRAS